MPLTKDFRWLIWLIALRRSAAAFFFAEAWRCRAARAARAPAETAGISLASSSWRWLGPPSRSSRSRSRNRSTCSSAGVRATSVWQRRWIWHLLSLVVCVSIYNEKHLRLYNLIHSYIFNSFHCHILFILLFILILAFSWPGPICWLISVFTYFLCIVSVSHNAHSWSMIVRQIFFCF